MGLNKLEIEFMGFYSSKEEDIVRIKILKYDKFGCKSQICTDQVLFTMYDFLQDCEVERGSRRPNFYL